MADIKDYIEIKNNREEGYVEIGFKENVRYSLLDSEKGDYVVSATTGKIEINFNFSRFISDQITTVSADGDELIITYYYYKKLSEKDYRYKRVVKQKIEKVIGTSMTVIIEDFKDDEDDIRPAGISEIRVKRQRFFHRVEREGKTLLNKKSNSFKDQCFIQGEEIKYIVTINIPESDPIFGELSIAAPDFEDTFLIDSKEKYRVRYNPKIQSFKTVIAEQKVDTIGGRFPLFVRNGNLKYKEIPISGLIAAAVESDDLETRKETPAPAPVMRTTAQQFADERKYKMKLEEWLRNGQPKIFRSAAEGNYIIRLMNISLQPIDTLGRMLHSFSATGYEVAEYSLDKAIEMGLYDEYMEPKEE